MRNNAHMSSGYHQHGPMDSEHNHARQKASIKVLGFSVVLTLSFAAVEFAAGLISGSIALLADAGHMVTDSSALFIALAAQLIATRPPTTRSSYGFGRVEVLAALLNALAMLGVVIWIGSQAIERFGNPREIAGDTVIVVAAIGLVVNLLVAWLLSKDKESINTRAALVHVMGDLLGSVAAITSGVVIYFTGWTPIDPLLSLFVCALILRSTASLFKGTFRILMDQVPESVSYERVAQDLSKVETIIAVHNLHIWESAPGQVLLTAHLEIRDLSRWPQTLATALTLLRERHGIDHATLQPELSTSYAEAS
jgi:cobalt-zinc-cadmium efflux system protein